MTFGLVHVENYYAAIKSTKIFFFSWWEEKHPRTTYSMFIILKSPYVLGTCQKDTKNSKSQNYD